MIDLTQHDEFVVARKRRVRLEPTLEAVDMYEFALADESPFCRVRQRVARSTERIGFYADKARTEPLMYFNMPPRFDPWARCELTDAAMDPVGEIQKAFVPRRRRSHYILYGRDREEVARVEVLISSVVARRRASGVAAAAVAGVLGIPVVGVAGAAAIAGLVAAAGIRQLRDWVDPLDVASELRVVRGEKAIGSIRRQPKLGTVGPAIPVPWESPSRDYVIDMRDDPSKSVDRRLVLAVPVALDTLRGVLAESPLR